MFQLLVSLLGFTEAGGTAAANDSDPIFPDGAAIVAAAVMDRPVGPTAERTARSGSGGRRRRVVLRVEGAAGTVDSSVESKTGVVRVIAAGGCAGPLLLLLLRMQTKLGMLLKLLLLVLQALLGGGR